MEQLRISSTVITQEMTQQFMFLVGQLLRLVYLKLVTHLNYKKTLALGLQILPLA
jgi:hypothetical protein